MGQNGEGSADKIQSIEIIMQREWLNITHDSSIHVTLFFEKKVSKSHFWSIKSLYNTDIQNITINETSL